MRDAVPQTINLKDYAPPAFHVSQVSLDVDIAEHRALVHATLRITRNAERGPLEPLVLDGEDLDLLGIKLNGAALKPDEYRVDASRLVIPNVPDAFTLETVVCFDPWSNTKLEGLYATASGLVTQCEAQGFRHITYFVDRPDVMARYTVTLCAERKRFPHLLANGNLVESGPGEPAEWFARELPAPALPEAGASPRHWARWEDPFPKPCYLFAMVAADLDLLEDHFVTRSGKRALLQIYVERGKLDQAGFAMQALKSCMPLAAAISVSLTENSPGPLSTYSLPVAAYMTDIPASRASTIFWPLASSESSGGCEAPSTATSPFTLVMKAMPCANAGPVSNRSAASVEATVLMASTKDLGTRCVTKSFTESFDVARFVDAPMSGRGSPRFTPGCSRFARMRPSRSETSEAVTNHPSALANTRPTDAAVPMWAMPTTSVEKTSGPMSILMSRRKMSEKSET